MIVYLCICLPISGFLTRSRKIYLCPLTVDAVRCKPHSVSFGAPATAGCCLFGSSCWVGAGNLPLVSAGGGWRVGWGLRVSAGLGGGVAAVACSFLLRWADWSRDGAAAQLGWGLHGVDDTAASRAGAAALTTCAKLERPIAQGRGGTSCGRRTAMSAVKSYGTETKRLRQMSLCAKTKPMEVVVAAPVCVVADDFGCMILGGYYFVHDLAG